MTLEQLYRSMKIESLKNDGKYEQFLESLDNFNDDIHEYAILFFSDYETCFDIEKALGIDMDLLDDDSFKELCSTRGCDFVSLIEGWKGSICDFFDYAFLSRDFIVFSYNWD